jgi:hypothetical protein
MPPAVRGGNIYETLFAVNSKFEVPQMVDTYEVSSDKLVYVSSPLRLEVFMPARRRHRPASFRHCNVGPSATAFLGQTNRRGMRRLFCAARRNNNSRLRA